MTAVSIPGACLQSGWPFQIAACPAMVETVADRDPPPGVTVDGVMTRVTAAVAWVLGEVRAGDRLLKTGDLCRLDFRGADRRRWNAAARLLHPNCVNDLLIVTRRSYDFDRYLRVDVLNLANLAQIDCEPDNPWRKAELAATEAAQAYRAARLGCAVR